MNQNQFPPPTEAMQIARLRRDLAKAKERLAESKEQHDLALREVGRMRVELSRKESMYANETNKAKAIAATTSAAERDIRALIAKLNRRYT